MYYTTGELDWDEDEVSLSGSLTAKVKSCLHSESFKCLLSKASLVCTLSLISSAPYPFMHGNTDITVFFQVKSCIIKLFYFICTVK